MELIPNNFHFYNLASKLDFGFIYLILINVILIFKTVTSKQSNTILLFLDCNYQIKPCNLSFLNCIQDQSHKPSNYDHLNNVISKLFNIDIFHEVFLIFFCSLIKLTSDSIQKPSIQEVKHCYLSNHFVGLTIFFEEVDPHSQWQSHVGTRGAIVPQIFREESSRYTHV